MARTLPVLLLSLFATAAMASGCGAPAAPRSDEPSASASTSGPLAGTTVLIDAGHNGGNASHPEIVQEPVDAGTHTKPCNTTGTVSRDGYPEHAFNFDVARRLAERLSALGSTVELNRTDDEGVGPCVDERAERAAEVGADLALSIHADGAPEELRGFHILAPKEIEGLTEVTAAPSLELAQLLRVEYEATTGLPPADYIGDDGVDVREDMAMLNLSAVPTVMVECGNMANAEDMEVLADPEGRQSIAEALAAGAAAFLERSELTAAD